MFTVVNDEIEECLRVLWNTVKADIPGATVGNLIALDLARGSSNPPSDHVFSTMLEILEFVATRRSCSANAAGAWHVFLWFEEFFWPMLDSQKWRIQHYVATNYDRFIADLVATEVAEWIGCFRDNWALEVITGWADTHETLEPDNVRGIRLAIDEFLHPDYGPMDGELRRKAIELSNALRYVRLGKPG